MELKASSNFYYYDSPSSSNTFPNNPNTNISYFPHIAIRAGYATASPYSRRQEFHRDPNLDFRHSIQRELEKERIRAEIIAEEVFRRKLLEDEVRRELMMGREMTMRRGQDDGMRELRFGSTIMSECRGGISPLLRNVEHREIGFCESQTLQFQRDPVVARNEGVKLKEIKEIKGFALDLSKDKVAFMAKPNTTDSKRKATTLPIEAPINPSSGLKKPKTKDEWSCALCKVNATSERALNDHLQGKKHKSNEQCLIPQKTGLGIGPSLIPDTRSYNLAKPIITPGPTKSPSPSLLKGSSELDVFVVKRVVKEVSVSGPPKPKSTKKSKASSLKGIKSRKKGKRFSKKGVVKKGKKIDIRVANSYSGMNRKRNQVGKQQRKVRL